MRSRALVSIGAQEEARRSARWGAVGKELLHPRHRIRPEDFAAWRRRNDARHDLASPRDCHGAAALHTGEKSRKAMLELPHRRRLHVLHFVLQGAVRQGGRRRRALGATPPKPPAPPPPSDRY